jgi:endonuclease/exonuclease/phosphatase family metal-dependent hydrolase
LPQQTADRPQPGRWRGLARTAVAVGVVLLSSSIAGTPVPSVSGAAAGAPNEPALPAAAAPGRAAPALSTPAVPGKTADFVLLQMNLCNSGMAVSCYSFGKAVDEAVAKIRQHHPDLVMVQEICRDDLYARDGWGKLARAMVDLYGGGDSVAVSFVPARSRFTGRPYQCLNGEQFGIGLVHHGDGRGRHYGWYRSQDLSDEVRAWTCATVIEGRLTGCTTHLSTDPDVAMRQCKELVSVLAAPWVMPEVVIAGDFNLGAAPSQAYDVHRCAPASYDIRGDGGLQQVFFSGGVQWVQGGNETMQFTDHPMLYERFRVRQ